jgi:hypothetical protein
VEVVDEDGIGLVGQLEGAERLADGGDPHDMPPGEEGLGARRLPAAARRAEEYGLVSRKRLVEGGLEARGDVGCAGIHASSSGRSALLGQRVVRGGQPSIIPKYEAILRLDERAGTWPPALRISFPLRNDAFELALICRDVIENDVGNDGPVGTWMVMDKTMPRASYFASAPLS